VARIDHNLESVIEFKERQRHYNQSTSPHILCC